MDRTESLVAAIQELGTELDAEDMEPNPERDDLGTGELQERVQAAFDALHDRVLPALAGALEDIEEAAERDAASKNVAWLITEVAALRWAAGDRKDVAPLLDRAIRVAPEGDVRDEMRAHLREPEQMLSLVRARWLQRHGEFDAADRLSKRVKSDAKSEVLKKLADELLASPRPLKSAPSLSTLNGVGAMVYGSRDRDERNGSYVTTHWFTVLFLPVFPLGAYRVIAHGGGSYTFLSKERLGPVARAWRWLVGAAAVAAVALFAWNSHTGSADYRATAAIEAATELEQTGDVEAAIGAYEQAIWEFTGEASPDALEPAAVAIVRLSRRSVTEPMTPGGVEQAARIVRRFEQLPPDARDTAAAVELSDALVGWADQVGADDVASAQASLRLLVMAEDLHDEPTPITPRREQLQLSLAAMLAEDWPVLALEHYARLLPHEEAGGAAGELLRGMLDAPSLLLDAEDAVASWTQQPPRGAEGLVGEVSSALEVARAMRDDRERRAALETADPDGLAALLERHPGDHDAVAALADIDRGAGKLDEAIARIEAVGPPGRLSTRLQQTLAGCYADVGRVDDAVRILKRYVDARMPAFQRAQAAYVRARGDRAHELTEQARRGPLPPDLDRRLMGASPEEQQEIFDEWLFEKLSEDSELERLRVRYERLSDVVPAALSLGTLELRRASGAGGEEREAHLAEAERLFLSIRQEAEGLPSFHLGLGQVYYRLGRDEEGERELRGLLEGDGDPGLALAVARAYRELGLVARAREVAEGVHESAPEPAKGQAAMLLSLVSWRLEDKERWLERAPQDDPMVMTSLLSVRARRASREGRLREAAEMYVEVAARYAEDAEHDQSAANNAAVAHQERYYCTGDMADLERAVQGLEGALRMAPDSPVTLGNLAGTQSFHANVQTLDRWVHTRMLRLTPDAARRLLNALAKGPLREEVLATLERDPAQRRALELTAQEQVLAPQRPWAWSRERGWRVRRVDGDGLRDLAERLGRVESLDTSQDAEQRERWLSGMDDEQMLADSTVAIEDSESRLRAARSAGHAPTRAAAAYLLGGWYLERAAITNDVADVEAAVEVYREASSSWPELRAERSLAAALMTLALFRGAGDDADRRSSLNDCMRHYGEDLCVHRLSGDDALGASLRDRPELEEAADLLRDAAAPFPGLRDWIVGRATGDAELEARGDEERASPLLRTSLELRARLLPVSEDTRERLALLR